MTPPLSVKGKRWDLARRTETDLTRHLLTLRQITDQESFFSPSFADHLHDGRKLRGMDEAIRLLATAVRERLPIGIFADYDVDGTAGAALVYELLRYLGVPVHIYIPTRAEGYGLSVQGVRALVSAGAKLILTVDLGITAGPVIKEIRKMNIGTPILITDHHQADPDRLPMDATIINPNQPGCSYPFKDLCGAAVVWKVMEQLLTELVADRSGQMSLALAESLLKWSLDLVALATTCDLVPLVDENRVLVYFGLKVIQKQRRLGLRTLCDAAGVAVASVTSKTLGFQIGPRLNAAVRMNQMPYSQTALGPQVSYPFALLTTRSLVEATSIVEELEDLNRQRRGLVDEIYNEAIAYVHERQLLEKSILIVRGQSWPPGVIGLVAGRLVEEFSRPAIVLTETSDGLLTGSVRSIPGFPVHEMLKRLEARLVNSGGHAMAGGLTLAPERQPDFTREIESLAAANLRPADLIPRLAIEAGIDLAAIDAPTLDQLDQFSPFGMANPRPLFLFPRIHLPTVRAIGATQNHLKSQIDLSKSILGSWDVIGFGLAPFRDLVSSGPVDLAGTIGWNVWQGNRKPQLEIIDVRVSA